MLWAGVYVGVGYTFSDEIQDAADRILRIGGYAAIGAFAGLFVLYMVVKIVRRRRALSEVIERISAGELRRKLDDGEKLVILDLRDEAEYGPDARIIPGTLRVDAAEVEDLYNEWRRDEEIVVYCA